MNKNSHRPAIAWIAGALYVASQFLCSAPVFAALGSDMSSVRVDREAMRGQLNTISMQHYDVHEIKGDDGMILREYANGQGKIFAVTWQGPMPPNLQKLFGTYFDQFQAAAADSAHAHPGMHRQLSITQPDFVLQALGKWGAFHGKAYVPSLVPAGVFVVDLP
jgi:hypothetical protein